METTPWDGVVRFGRDLATVNLDPGHRVYGEELRAHEGVEYRLWDPFRSKLAAYLLNGAPTAPWLSSRSVLYLGAAHGTTISHLSDLLPKATIFAIEKSPVAFAPLLALARRRENLLPILADAQLPERFAADVGEVDLLYQDVAQRGQASIFSDNASACLAADGAGLLMLKVRSVTQARPARAVIEEARTELSGRGFALRPPIDLGPFSREHVAIATSVRGPSSTVRR